jgi:hypothetical protein
MMVAYSIVNDRPANAGSFSQILLCHAPGGNGTVYSIPKDFRHINTFGEFFSKMSEKWLFSLDEANTMDYY